MIYERQISLWMAILLIILPASLHARETDREQVLADDINRLGERALRDRIISEEEHTQMLCFVRDSLPEGTDLKVRALEQIRDELDVMGYLGRQMLPDRLDIPEDYVSPEEERLAMKQAALRT